MEHRVAIVTGGGGGIGGATCVALARRGMAVVVVGRTPGRVARTVEEARRHAGSDAPCLPFVMDVRDERCAAEMAAVALERFGRIDLLVCAAGIGRSPRATRLAPYPVAQLPLDEWNAIVDTNLTGTFLANRAVLPVMIRQREGTIVNIASSPGGLRGQAFAAAYCASKFGVRGLSQALAEEVRPFGVRVEVLHPDAVDTGLIRHSTLGGRLGPPIQPERVAELIVEMVAAETVVHAEFLLAPFRSAPAGSET